MNELKEKTIRGGVARLSSQLINFALRLGSLMLLARLLVPQDFGLVGMVTAFTGVLNLFRDFGLSAASVQRVDVTEEQVSNLFWINIWVGGGLAIIAAVAAPFVAAFYHESRLVGVTFVLASSFIFNAAGIQHSARLQRELRFTSLSVIGTVSLVLSTVIAVVMAKLGYGYWALVAMTVAMPLLATIGFWVTTGWIPSMPKRGVGIRSMMRFGVTVTLNGLVVYAAYNLEKVLLGRYWGAAVIGLYGRAYQLINIPTDNLNSSVGEVAFSALARVQNDAERFRSYFLKGYAVVVGMTLPITIICALFANETIHVLLGPKWNDAADIFRLLAPTVLTFAMINPLGWLLLAKGMAGRSLKVALVLAPVVIAGYVVGLPYGAKGVALGYSVALALWVVPHIAWCIKGTGISVKDILVTVSRPLFSGFLAAALTAAVRYLFGQSWSPFVTLVIGCSVFLIAYSGLLLFVMGQKAFYLDLFRGLLGRTSSRQEVLASA